MRSPAAVVVLLLAVLLPAVAGCSVQVAGTPHADMTGLWVTPPAPLMGDGVFTDPGGRFTLAPPPGWSMSTAGPKGTAAVFADPQPLPPAVTGRFNANINVVVAPTPADLGRTVSGAQQELRRLPGYTSTADEPLTLSDGTPARLIGGRFTDPDGRLALRNLQLIAVHAGRAYVVTGTALQQLWDRYEQTFRTSLASLTVAT
jgi:hypothetical protein